jgi:3-oxoacyl-[acyl-carrier-protein] synthase II
VDPARVADRGFVLLVGTAIGGDAHHETAPHLPAIVRTMRAAYDDAGLTPDDGDLVVAHGTGTALNDPAEAAALTELFAGTDPGPVVTGVKGATGHTSGAAALTNLVVGVHAARSGLVPPVVGLRTPLPEGAGLRLVVEKPAVTAVRRVQVNAFGFSGLNAVLGPDGC